MAAPRDRKHIVVPGEPQTENYTPHGKKITPAVPPANPDRPAHGAALAQSLVAAQTTAAARRQQAQIEIEGSTPSIYVEFQSAEDIRLELSTLEAERSGIELVSVRHETVPQPDGSSKIIEWATVVIPDGKVKHFLKRFETYRKTEEKEKGERRYENMIDRISGLRLATLHALWTDTGTPFPAEQTARWWEVWLRKFDGGEIKRFTAFCQQTNLSLSARRLEFEDRTVVLVLATAVQLAMSLDVLNDLAELRSVHQPAGFFVNLTAAGQAEWMNDLLNRTTHAPDNAPAICVWTQG